MPNHITSEVEITGTKEQIAKLIKDTKIVLDHDVENNEFDFNGIVKMPPELLNTVSPTQIVETEEEAQAKNKERQDRMAKNKWPGMPDVAFLSKAEAARREKEYGALNWYDWSYNNWGTKWNSYEVRYIAHSETTLVLKLETAWNTPRVIWETLEERGFTVKGIMYGEMEGYEYIGEGSDAFEAYVDVQVDYIGKAA